MKTAYDLVVIGGGPVWLPPAPRTRPVCGTSLCWSGTTARAAS